MVLVRRAFCFSLFYFPFVYAGQLFFLFLVDIKERKGWLWTVITAGEPVQASMASANRYGLQSLYGTANHSVQCFATREEYAWHHGTYVRICCPEEERGKLTMHGHRFYGHTDTARVTKTSGQSACNFKAIVLATGAPFGCYSSGWFCYS